MNNLSQAKTVSKLPHYNKKLSELVVEQGKPVDTHSYFTLLKKQAEASYEYIKQYYEGIYNMYYICSDSKGVKREPFMIKPNAIEKYVECYKGNVDSRVRYAGIGILINMHTLSLHLVEENNKPEEYMMMNLSIPFIRNMGYLRGIFNTISFARQPIARKMIIMQVSDICDEKIYNQMDVVFYDKPTDVEHSEIMEYLYSPKSITECYMISNPRFDLSDLTHEVDLARDMEKRNM